MKPQIKTQKAFTLIETLISIALLAMIIAFTLQMQQRFARNVSTQEYHQCVAERVGRVQKQLYHKRPLVEIKTSQNCSQGSGSTIVDLEVLSGTYPPAIPTPDPDSDDPPPLSACTEVEVSVVRRLHNKDAERFSGEVYVCDFGE
ncbi:MAG: type II secretion system protein [Candidatus Sericytochromatia bacterium]|nr:type II secretion system protein [Candidatus Sericytochromatia bacterium]